ncbi:hypothetical protein [Alicyclobacillus fastidiosus]|uniref:Uncharacterized protein n=1 Tax=Alicyclobacillus fastidiosus TaxID=392011 RepID=A0ABV5ALG5_9BACL|nr:hypothetical protein [Alicyclobacillus fastidiosus]WEH11078.1 hypothetical protein PYS47_07630 [Alicyclobacillus fastidiosus]
MSTGNETAPTVLEIAACVTRYLMGLDVPEDTKREALRMAAQEFEKR